MEEKREGRRRSEGGGKGVMRSNRTVDVNTGGEHTDPSASGHLQKAQMDVIRRKDIRATSV